MTQLNACRLSERRCAWADGRTLGVPLAWFPRLLRASAEQRGTFRISRRGLHWESSGRRHLDCGTCWRDTGPNTADAEGCRITRQDLDHRADGDQFAIQRHVLPRRGGPAEVAGHRLADHAPPTGLVAVKRDRALNRAEEVFGSFRVEGEAGRAPGGQGRGVGVDDGVGEPAGAAHQRQRAVAQGIELRQAARLEARRHDDAVAARHNQVRQRLVIAERHPDPAGMSLRRCREAGFEIAVAAAKQDEPAAECDQPRQGGEQEVEPLLRGQPGDRAEQRRITVRRDAKSLRQRPLSRGLPRRRIVDAIAARQQGIFFRRPDKRVDAVQNPGQHIGAAAQQPVETPAEGRGLDFSGISRADRRQTVGIKQPGFEE